MTPARPQQPIRIQRQRAKRQCVLCNGTGLICDICGEAEGACRCGYDTATYSDCPDCGGTGR